MLNSCTKRSAYDFETPKKLFLQFSRLDYIFVASDFLKNYYETKLLMLNSEKSKKKLNWKAQYNLNDSIKLISDWYKQFLIKKNVLKICQGQILNFLIK